MNPVPCGKVLRAQATPVAFPADVDPTVVDPTVGVDR